MTAAPEALESLSSSFYYLRYYAGHVGRHGNEFIEFEVTESGRLRYSNSSSYRSEKVIMKEARVSPAVIEELKYLLVKERICDADDEKWPEPDRNGRQELEVRVGNTHISFLTNMLNTHEDVAAVGDANLNHFYAFVKELRNFILELVSLHFKIKAV